MQSQRVAYFILDLLQQVPTVFVANLGRFDAIFHPAVIDIEQARIKPPHIEPDFVPQVEAEAGILPAYMHYVTGMNITEANEQVSLFVNDILRQVDTEQPYNIEKFGTFSKSALGVLHFTPDWDAFNLTFNDLKIIDLHEEKDHVAPPVYSTPVVPEFKVAGQSFKPVPTEPVKVEPVSDPVIEEEIPESTLARNVEEPQMIDESTTRLAWIILTSALILITVLCAYLAWDIISDRQRINQLTHLYPDTLAITKEFDIPVKTDSNHTINSNDSLVQPVTPIDSIAKSDSAEKSVTIKNPDTIEKTNAISNPDTSENTGVKEVSGPPCFIVVGAFSNSENVSRMVARLEASGYKTEQIKGGSLTRVAISTSCDKDNLQKVLAEAKSAINPEAWIY
ncbi:MAG: SPOR domain-containing protein [Saprospiraceae bacterium]